MKGNSVEYSVENHRNREKGILVYPVYSRRSRGLSLGINLFPDRKVCSFDCPYCEVFPFEAKTNFSLERMEEELQAAIAAAQERKIIIKDICFSGNGEPSLSPHLPQALENAFRIRDTMAPEAALVLITNGTGLLQKSTFDFLVDTAQDELRRKGLDIWLKTDAGTGEWFKKINRPRLCDHTLLLERIRDFSAAAPFTAQCMICKVEGSLPPEEEEAAWVKLIIDLSAPGRLKSVQIYGKARPSPEDPLAEAVEPLILEKRGDILRAAMEASALTGALPMVEIFP
jgi:histidinol dehydrogenase